MKIKTSAILMILIAGLTLNNCSKSEEKVELEHCVTIFDYAAFAENNPESSLLNKKEVKAALKKHEEVMKVLSEDDVNDILATVATSAASTVNPNETATIETPFGKMTVKFYSKEAPNHAANFKRLANAGYYNGTKFHRIIPNFVIQGGDILSRDENPGNDGTGGPGYSVDAEFNDIHHRLGILSMARSQNPNSAGSQFFVVAGDVPHLDGQYTVFGEVTEGLEVIEKIVKQKRNSRDNPNTPIPMYVYMNE